MMAPKDVKHGGEYQRRLAKYAKTPSIHGIFQARVLEWGAIAFSPLLALNSFTVYQYGLFIGPKQFFTFISTL